VPQEAYATARDDVFPVVPSASLTSTPYYTTMPNLMT
jgi:hypothetical protein